MSRLVALAVAFAALLAAPLLVGGGAGPAASTDGEHVVIVITPHAEQVRQEFGRAFAAWHQDRFGEPAQVIWSAPGGAVEIRRSLQSAWEARLRQGVPVGGDADVLFGGGSYEFETLRRPVSVQVGQETRAASVLEPLQLPEPLRKACYAQPELAGQRLFDPEGFWYGTALATFGIVWNGPVLARLHVDPPTGWTDLADARLQGWVTLVNPAQSGSVLTAFESIVQRAGWEPGLAILRRAAANARTFAPGGPRGPIDVAAGDAAMAVSIDFYGRLQAQVIDDAARATKDAAAQGRVQFTVPHGQAAVDPDPVGMLRNPPHRRTAERFVQFCLSPEGQRLWQLPPGAPGGPRDFALRRMPVMRSLYDQGAQGFVDRVNPYAEASAPTQADPAMRAFLPVLFAAMAMDVHPSLRQAWSCITRHPAWPASGGVVTAAQVTDPELRAWLARFDALPTVETPDGPRPLVDPAGLRALRDGWLRGGWRSSGLWHPQDEPAEALRRRWRDFFQENYAWIVAQAKAKGTA